MILELTYAGVDIRKDASTLAFNTFEQIVNYANPYVTVTTWNVEFGGLGVSLPVSGEVKLQFRYPDEGTIGTAEGPAVLQNIMVDPWGQFWCGTIIPLEDAEWITYTDDTCPIDALMNRRHKMDKAIRREALSRTIEALDGISGEWVLVVSRFHERCEEKVDGLVDALETAAAFVEHNVAYPLAITCDGVEIIGESDIHHLRS